MGKREWRYFIPPVDKLPSEGPNALSVEGVHIAALYTIAERLEALVDVIEERWPTMEEQVRRDQEDTKAFLELNRKILGGG